MRREERAAAATAAGLVVTLVAALTGVVALQREAPGPTPQLTLAEPLAVEQVQPLPAPEIAEPTRRRSPPPEPAPEPQPAPDPEPATAPQPVSAQPRAPPPAPAPTVQAAQAQPGPSDSERIFADGFPAHAAARQRPDDPASHHWAVLVGVNRYQGRTGDTLGSVADVAVLRAELLRRGWRDDHILVLTDGHATHDGSCAASSGSSALPASAPRSCSASRGTAPRPGRHRAVADRQPLHLGA
jgi:outer membrane biosynthesis protein TonB